MKITDVFALLVLLAIVFGVYHGLPNTSLAFMATMFFALLGGKTITAYSQKRLQTGLSKRVEKKSKRLDC